MKLLSPERDFLDTATKLASGEKEAIRFRCQQCQFNARGNDLPACQSWAVFSLLSHFWLDQKMLAEKFSHTGQQERDAWCGYKWLFPNPSMGWDFLPVSVLALAWVGRRWVSRGKLSSLSPPVLWRSRRLCSPETCPFALPLLLCGRNTSVLMLAQQNLLWLPPVGSSNFQMASPACGGWLGMLRITVWLPELETAEMCALR